MAAPKSAVETIPLPGHGMTLTHRCLRIYQTLKILTVLAHEDLRYGDTQPIRVHDLEIDREIFFGAPRLIRTLIDNELDHVRGIPTDRFTELALMDYFRIPTFSAA